MKFSTSIYSYVEDYPILGQKDLATKSPTPINHIIYNISKVQIKDRPFKDASKGKLHLTSELPKRAKDILHSIRSITHEVMNYPEESMN